MALPELTQHEISEYEKGSKLQLAAWYAYTALIWSLKGTMLCFFSRMTIGTWHNVFVKTVSILSAVCYVAVFLTVRDTVAGGLESMTNRALDHFWLLPYTEELAVSCDSLNTIV